MIANPADIQQCIAAALPGAQVSVTDPQNDGTHLQAVVKAPQFQGLSRVQQHRMVYAALGNAFATHLHALQLHTSPLTS